MSDVGRLRGAEARRTLRQLLTGERRFATAHFEEPLYQRVAAAVELLRDNPSSDMAPTPLDLAVLMRQVLRFEAGALADAPDGPTATAFYHVPQGARWPTEEHWRRTSVVARPGAGNTFRLESARPWAPDWLGGVDVDGAAAACRPRRPTETVPGDPFLKSIGRADDADGPFSTYHSPGQRAAIRAALTAPPGSTTAICLPTGEGKSLVFQAIASVGFGDAADAGPGVVVAIVPTTALALDHERSLHALNFERRPYAYVARGEVERRAIREQIEQGTQGLVFTSPEAVTRSLRWSLECAAKAGRLRALVVDEAHIVDQWGTDFRPDFQVLRGVRAELHRLCRVGPAFRTVLLSATLTESALRTILELFSAPMASDGSGGVGVVASSRLRPEPAYWIAPESDPETRRQRVIEALLHLPRPAIVYTTRVEDAKALYGALRAHDVGDVDGCGFGRLGLMHGETPTASRDILIDGWRRRTIDVMVATSAFGLGIDNADVRAVVHACIPETLDRFYQEVGRGGRDGRASLSVLIPSDDDWSAARALNRRTLIGEELGLERWASMFEHRAPLSDLGVEGMRDAFAVRVDAPGGLHGERRFMMSPLSDSWHLQTLNLMAGAGSIELLAPPARRVDRDADERASDGHRYQLVALRDPRLNPPTGPVASQAWEEFVQGYRSRLGNADQQSLAQMRRFMDGGQRGACAAESLAPLYETPAVPDLSLPAIAVTRACGGCPACRKAGRQPQVLYGSEPPLPWAPRALSPALADMLGARRRLFVFYPPHRLAPDTADAATVRRLTEALRGLIQAGLRNVAALGTLAVTPDSLAEPRSPLFVTEDLDLFGVEALPAGPILVLVGPGTAIPHDELSGHAHPGAGRLFLLPESYPAPGRIGTPLRDILSDPHLTLDRFVARYGSML